MILYIGNENSAFLLRECAGEEEVKVVGAVDRIDKIEPLILGERYTSIVIDLKPIVDYSNDIAEKMAIYKMEADSNYVFFAIGHTERTELVSAMIDKGFYSFVTNTIPGKAKDQLKLALGGFATVAIVQEQEIREQKEEAEILKTEKAGIRTIGVVGCCPRIGTTTQALQIVRYLASKGKKACYLSSTGEDLADWIDVYGADDLTTDDTYRSRLRIKGIDIYYDPNKIDKIKEMGYDYIVYDYGSIDNKYFKSYVMLEKNIRIVVCGNSPKEITAMRKVYDSLLSDATYYIFSFVADADKDDVMQGQSELSEKTIFAAYSPDPFVLSGKVPYGNIIKTAKTEAKQPKKRWFGRSK